jgi:two-component system phosphate regulon response regulator OmpR
MVQSGRHRRFSSYTFDLKTGDLTRHRVRLRLEHQPKTVLRMLIEADGDLVARSELIGALWPGESEGDFDRRLDKAMAKLRSCLKDNPQNPRYIETLRGLGYRLLVKVTAEPTGPELQQGGTL